MRPTPGAHSVTPSDHPAIDVPNCASYPTGVVAKQEGDNLCNVIRCANPANRMKAVEGGKCFVNLAWVDERLINGCFNYGG